MMSTPRRFRIEQIEEALRQSAGIKSLAAKRLGCSPSAITKYLQRFPSLTKVIDDIVNENLDLAEGQLLKAIGDGNMTAIIFYLKTKGKDRGFAERREMTGVDGSAVEIKAVGPTILLPPESND